MSEIRISLENYVRKTDIYLNPLPFFGHNKSMNEKLKTLRLLNNLTKESVSNHLGINRKTYSAIEKGEKVIDVEQLKSLAQLYKKNIGFFFEIELVANSLDDPITNKIIDDAKLLKKRHDFHKLMSWVNRYERHFSHFNNTIYMKQYLLYKSIAVFHNKVEHDASAIKIAEASLKMTTPNHSFYLEAEIYRELGVFHYHLYAFDAAKALWDKALKIINKSNLKYSDVHISVLLSIATMLEVVEKYEHAEEVIDEAMLCIATNTYLERELFIMACLVKARLNSYNQNFSTAEKFLNYARSFTKALEVTPLQGYIKKIERVVELSKVGISSHEGKLIVAYNPAQVLEIYNFYTSQPEIKKKIKEKKIEALKRQIEQIEKE